MDNLEGWHGSKNGAELGDLTRLCYKHPELTLTQVYLLFRLNTSLDQLVARKAVEASIEGTNDPTGAGGTCC